MITSVSINLLKSGEGENGRKSRYKLPPFAYLALSFSLLILLGTFATNLFFVSRTAELNSQKTTYKRQLERLRNEEITNDLILSKLAKAGNIIGNQVNILYYSGYVSTIAFNNSITMDTLTVDESRKVLFSGIANTPLAVQKFTDELTQNSKQIKNATITSISRNSSGIYLFTTEIQFGKN